MSAGLDIFNYNDPKVNDQFKAMIIANHAVTEPEEKFLKTAFLALNNIGWLKLKAAQALAYTRGTSFMAPSAAMEVAEAQRSEVVNKIIKNLINLETTPQRRYGGNVESGIEKVEKELSGSDPKLKELVDTFKFAWEQAGSPSTIGDTLRLMVTELIPSRKMNETMDRLDIKVVTKNPKDLILKVQNQIDELEKKKTRMTDEEEKQCHELNDALGFLVGAAAKEYSARKREGEDGVTQREYREKLIEFHNTFNLSINNARKLPKA